MQCKTIGPGRKQKFTIKEVGEKARDDCRVLQKSLNVHKMVRRHPDRNRDLQAVL